MEKFSKAQEMQLQIIGLSTFNCFDGKQVEEDLRKNRHLWRTAYMTRLKSLIMLRDLDMGDGLNIDTLYLTPQEGKEDELKELAEKWGADKCFWIGGEMACRLLGSYSQEKRANNKQILKLWWD